MTPAEPRPLAAPAPDALPALSGLRVLVVDDCRDAADATAMLLRVCGAEAEACYCGTSALLRLPGLRPDACILDVSMPGLDGPDLAEFILLRAGGGPLLIALTGYDDERTRQRIADGAFDLHLVKPADPGTLVRALAAHQARLQAEAVGDGVAATL